MILLTSELYYRLCNKVMVLEPEFPARGWQAVLLTTMEDKIREGFEIKQMQISAMFHFSQMSEPIKTYMISNHQESGFSKMS